MGRTGTHRRKGQDEMEGVEMIEKNGRGTIKVGNLESRRDFTDVRDIVKAYYLAVKKCDSGEIYNICSGKSYTISHILDTLLKLSNSNIDIEKDNGKIRQDDIPELLGNNSKFCSKTGWLPTIDLNKTLNDILDYWRKQIL